MLEIEIIKGLEVAISTGVVDWFILLLFENILRSRMGDDGLIHFGRSSGRVQRRNSLSILWSQMGLPEPRARNGSSCELA